MDEYVLKVAGVERKLPVVRIADNIKIASFVILGDTELVTLAAAELKKRIPEADYLITAEAKGIPLIQELARISGMKRYVVARKSIKPYMSDPFVTEVYSITTQRKQLLCIEKEESEMIKGKRILIVDDVISTGESVRALEKLIKRAGGTLVGKAAILAEGEDAINREDIIYLEKLPLFPIDPSDAIQ
ncbi:phosphoribosyltransferase family protein [Sporolactobacillus laevolacticus]|jgi:adenine phosphoribosyltransferase|uniref:Adenine phosphoribosyltransferase n=1 Tax=Sporolactobacillus laevolacticus DSM 442 TaxID=1395513 RepID=V6IUH3_9BACL|nr:phosphoribosyltransferase family protein [Sporolactobacillus laevolacticus]EST10733.1 adenine phosphoribosyltransferase [Sporolactobacillus laevolacticus DSM 442]MDF2911623.1 adenine phosphoribosyltransferase [Sporolactobacillus laevolacticus]